MKSRAVVKSQKGQTLIETMVAIFILVIGLGSAIALANYSYQAQDSSSKQVLAAALARQAVEAVTNMRDTNWLNDTLVDCSSDYGQPAGSGAQFCYKNWLFAVYALGSGSAGSTGINYALNYNNSNNTFSLGANPANFNLYYNSATGSYTTNGADLPTVYSRLVNLVQDQSAPFSSAEPRLIITVTVWWYDHLCPKASDPSALPPSCKVTLVNYLTNWRNY